LVIPQKQNLSEFDIVKIGSLCQTAKAWESKDTGADAQE
jgi:hypothetical protein